MLLFATAVLAGPPSPETLGDRLAADAGRRLETRCAHDASQAAIRCDDHGVASLASLRAAYADASRKQRKALYKRWLELLVDPDAVFDAALVPGALRPMVKSRADLLQLARQLAQMGRSDPPPSAPITSTLRVGLALDAPDALRVAGTADLEALDLTFEAALAVAIDNLASTDATPGTLVDGVFLLATGDGYDSARFLVPDAFADLGLKGRPVVLLAGRDLVFVTGDAQPEGIEQLLTLSARTLADDQLVKRISLVPVVATDDGWADLELPDDHPAASMLASLRQLQTGQWYHDQRIALEGTDGPPVAPLAGLQLPDGTGRHLVAIEPMQLRLPVADDVVFVHDDTPYLVPWDTFVGLAEPTPVEGSWPPLFAVDGAALLADLSRFEAVWAPLPTGKPPTDR
jgi:hypothetical protein